MTLKLVPPHALSAEAIDDFAVEYQNYAAVCVPSAELLPTMSGKEFLRTRPWLAYVNNFCFFSINEVDEIVGVIRLTCTNATISTNAAAYNIGMAIRPSHRGLGYGKEQLRLGLDWLRSFYTKNRVYVATKVANEIINKTVIAVGGSKVTTRSDGFTIWEFNLNR